MFREVGNWLDKLVSLCSDSSAFCLLCEKTWRLQFDKAMATARSLTERGESRREAEFQEDSITD